MSELGLILSPAPFEDEEIRTGIENSLCLGMDLGEPGWMELCKVLQLLRKSHFPNFPIHFPNSFPNFHAHLSFNQELLAQGGDFASGGKNSSSKAPSSDNLCLFFLGINPKSALPSFQPF